MNEPDDRLQISRGILREAGLRATPARMAVLALLSASQTPFTHQEITDRVQSIGIDKSTVFRTLQDLAKVNLIRRMELGDHVWRYERTENADTASHHTGPHHPHLLCVDCGSITCLSEEEVGLTLPKSLGQIEDVLLKGHCADCNQTIPTGEPS